ncbi:hypothetical protein CEJ09_17650, partial [Salmonella enterica]|nr:hypothetical protein [Salmonella enterica]
MQNVTQTSAKPFAALHMQQKYGREDSFSPDAKTKRLTTVYLDKDRGAEMNIRALGGRYYR